MNLFRAVAMMVLAAVANPLCCCFAGLVPGAEAAGVADEAATAEHACCAGPKEADDSSGGKADAHADCRHLQERDAQINQSGDLAAISSPLLGRLVGEAYEAAPSKAADATTDSRLGRVRLGGDAFATPRERARVYCVFLL